jgi:hypothetical protein
MYISLPLLLTAMSWFRIILLRRFNPPLDIQLKGRAADKTIGDEM